MNFMIEEIKLFHRRQMLFRSINVINLILIILIARGSIYSILESHSWMMFILQCVTFVIFFIASYLFRSNILLNKEPIDSEIYAKAWIIYFLMIIGTLPVCLLAYTQGNPSIISEYGLSSFKAMASLSNLLIPISIILFISLCYWLEFVFVKDENGVYIKCHELKKSILE